jgi:hypothetical protein
MYNKPFVLEGTTMYDLPISAANKYGIAGGSLTYAYGWLTDSSNAVFIGVVVTLIGLIISAVSQFLRNRRETRAAQLNEELARKEEARRQEIHELTIRSLTANKIIEAA